MGQSNNLLLYPCKWNTQKTAHGGEHLLETRYTFSSIFVSHVFVVSVGFEEFHISLEVRVIVLGMQHVGQKKSNMTLVKDTNINCEKVLHTTTIQT